VERSSGSTILGRLELIREETPSVGVQVFGPTWAVLDSETGELARACVLDEELLPDPAAREAFTRGLEALSSLREPTLVPQLLAGHDDHGGAVLYEPTPGGVAFDDLFDGTGSYELPVEVGRLARQLARALAALHARGHVHGMLASACVFVGPRGPAVYQYGLAPLCDRAVLLRRVRAFNLSNLAPEVMAGGDFTPAADLYAWAVTVAQFASGVRGAAALEVARGIDELPGLTPSLRAAVQACLADDPAARPRDGVELLRVIETAGLGEGSGALRPDAEAAADREPLASPPEPPPALVTAAPVSATPPPAIATPATSTPATSTPATSAPEPAKPRPATMPPTRPPVPKDRPGTIPPAGMSLPVTSFEEMLMTGDRARRPGTIPPGSMNLGVAPPPTPPPPSASPAASASRSVVELTPEDMMHESGSWTRGGQPSGKSASNLRRVHVLTDPVKRPNEGRGEARTGAPEDVLEARSTEPMPRGEVIIGGTREELDAASQAATLRLDPASAAEAVRAANEAAAAASATGAPIAGEPAARRSEASPAAPDRRAPSSAEAGAPTPGGGRRRSSAVSGAGNSEPKDWGTIPPIQNLVPAAPPAASSLDVAPSAIPEVAERKPPLPLLLAVAAIVLLVIVLWVT